MIETFTLRNGVVVLARNTKRIITETTDYFTCDPYHFSNHTQAERKAAMLRAEGIDAAVYKSPAARPFYVQIIAK